LEVVLHRIAPKVIYLNCEPAVNPKMLLFVAYLYIWDVRCIANFKASRMTFVWFLWVLF